MMCVHDCPCCHCPLLLSVCVVAVWLLLSAKFIRKETGKSRRDVGSQRLMRRRKIPGVRWLGPRPCIACANASICT